MLGILIVGTLQVPVLTGVYLEFPVSAGWAQPLQNALDRIVPSNIALGIEGISIHGVLLIALLIAISKASIKGFINVDQGISWPTITTLGLISMTLIVAALNISHSANGLKVGFTGRLAAEILLIAAVWLTVKKYFFDIEPGSWLWETWRFVKQIIPLLMAGVFLAGIARALIPADWVMKIAGRNTLLANLAGVIFGVFIYFPTQVEVPIAQTFLSLGMHRGPLLAYLLADPELSLKSIMITNFVIGKKRRLYM